MREVFLLDVVIPFGGRGIDKLPKLRVGRSGKKGWSWCGGCSRERASPSVHHALPVRRALHLSESGSGSGSEVAMLLQPVIGMSGPFRGTSSRVVEPSQATRKIIKRRLERTCNDKSVSPTAYMGRAGRRISVCHQLSVGVVAARLRFALPAPLWQETKGFRLRGWVRAARQPPYPAASEQEEVVGVSILRHAFVLPSGGCIGLALRRVSVYCTFTASDSMNNWVGTEEGERQNTTERASRQIHNNVSISFTAASTTLSSFSHSHTVSPLC